MPFGPDGSMRAQRVRHEKLLVLAKFLHDLLLALQASIFHKLHDGLLNCVYSVLFLINDRSFP